MRPIDADALCKALREAPIRMAVDKGKMFRLIDNAPTVSAAPVQTATWYDESWYDESADRLRRAGYKCSNCWHGTAIKSDYCPYCGAKMDRGAKP